MIAAFAFLSGLAVGSFMNVCIHRLPKGESVVRPRSHCPRCRQPIAAYDNIPLISFLLLGGRCRRCRAPIPFLYPFVELLTGLLFLLVYFRFGLTPQGFKAVLLSAALVVLIFTDLRDRLLPDRITYPGIVAGLVFSFWVPLEDGTAALLLRFLSTSQVPQPLLSLAEALLGAILGAGLLFVLGEIWYRLRKVEAMGLGDVKMMAMVGLFFGFRLTLLTLLLGSLMGTVIGSLFILLAKKDSRYELPLGTFLGLAALVTLFWGQELIAGYLGLIG